MPASHAPNTRELPPGIHQHRGQFTTSEIVRYYHPDYDHTCTDYEPTDCTETVEYTEHSCPNPPDHANDTEKEYAEECHKHQKAFADKSENRGAETIYFREIIGPRVITCTGRRPIDP